MDEEQNTTETAEDNNDSGNQQQRLTLIDEANAAAERLEKTKAELKAENDRLERLLAEQKLGGSVGQAPQPQQKKETDAEYSARVRQAIAEGKFNDPNFIFK